MIRARLSDGSFLLGVDAENIRRLTSGQPIAIDLFAMGGKDKVVLIYGDTITDIREKLEKVFGSLPPAQPYTEGNA